MTAHPSKQRAGILSTWLGTSLARITQGMAFGFFAMWATGELALGGTHILGMVV